MKKSSRKHAQSCALPLPPVLLIGAILSAAFFGLILAGPLDFAILRRYCLSHPVAVASVCLFFVGIVGLTLKWQSARTQSRATEPASDALRELVAAGEDIQPNKRAEWLISEWELQSVKLQNSWFGIRLARVLELQVSRGRRNLLESDLKSLADQDADRQHDSYSLLRIINWAMPMLGFLGTVLGISQTLGQLDTKMLATQQQDAMNQLTAGLYVAFDTTAIALILTVVSMFVQFAVSRLEQNILSEIDSESSDCLIQFLSADPHDAEHSLLTPVREVMESLVEGVEYLVTQQSTVWAQSLQETQRQWTQWSEQSFQQIESQFGERISHALDKHVADLAQLQDDGGRNQDLRWQQWQTTLSDQARTIQGQQKEMIKQSESLQRLVDSTTELRKLEDTIQDSLSRLENVNRIEQATNCVGEAVAVLATCLERAGVIRGTPLKPRITKQSTALDTHGELADAAVHTTDTNSSDTESTAVEAAETSQPIIPFDSQRRKAA